MAPMILRRINPDNGINILSLILAIGIGIAGLFIAYATYRLQLHLHRQNFTTVYELEAPLLRYENEARTTFSVDGPRHGIAHSSKNHSSFESRVSLSTPGQ